MASPSLRVTIAFFQDGRRPAYRPYVRRLARTIMVRTPVTDTLNSDSMAALICGLLASEWTRNAYSLRAPYAADDFSVTTGRTAGRCRPSSDRPRLTGHHAPCVGREPVGPERGRKGSERRQHR